jgi:RNA polymerase sigma-70 factor (ECF subfamily)
MVHKVRATGDKSAARQALAGLCKDYWYPLYAFARRQGNSSPDAQDLTQGFFAHLVETNLFADAQPERGKLRSFLLAAFQRYLGHAKERDAAVKRGGQCEFVPLDAVVGERRYACEPLDLATPEKLFERSWALAVLQTALRKLAADEAQEQRGSEFRELEPFIASDERGGGGYLRAATRLGMSEENARQAVTRLRKRFREGLRQQIADTLVNPTPAHVEEEMTSLRAALRG